MKRLKDGIDVQGKRPCFPFYTSDYQDDTRGLSADANSLWIDMLCVMNKSSRRGYLIMPSGSAMTPEQIWRKMGRTGQPLEVVERALAELSENGIYSVDRDGAIYCRRMVKESRISAIRREAGAKAAHLKRGEKGQFQQQHGLTLESGAMPVFDGFAPAKQISVVESDYCQGGFAGAKSQQKTSLSSSSSISIEESSSSGSSVVVSVEGPPQGLSQNQKPQTSEPQPSENHELLPVVLPVNPSPLIEPDDPRISPPIVEPIGWKQFQTKCLQYGVTAGGPGVWNRAREMFAAIDIDERREIVRCLEFRKTTEETAEKFRKQPTSYLEKEDWKQFKGRLTESEKRKAQAKMQAKASQKIFDEIAERRRLRALEDAEDARLAALSAPPQAHA